MCPLVLTHRVLNSAPILTLSGHFTREVEGGVVLDWGHEMSTLYLFSCTEQMLAHCHRSKNGGATNMLLDNDNVDYIAQEMVPITALFSPSLWQCMGGGGIVMGRRQQCWEEHPARFSGTVISVPSVFPSVWSEKHPDCWIEVYPGGMAAALVSGSVG